MSRYLNAQQKLSVCTVVHPDAHGEHHLEASASVSLTSSLNWPGGIAKFLPGLFPPIQIARHGLVPVLLRNGGLSVSHPPADVRARFPFQFGKHAIRQDAYAKPSHIERPSCDGVKRPHQNTPEGRKNGFPYQRTHQHD